MQLLEEIILLEASSQSNLKSKIMSILTNFASFFDFGLIDNAVSAFADNAFDFILLHLDDFIEIY